jgi:hypothetical protein
MEATGLAICTDASFERTDGGSGFWGLRGLVQEEWFKRLGSREFVLKKFQLGKLHTVHLTVQLLPLLYFNHHGKDHLF